MPEFRAGYRPPAIWRALPLRLAVAAIPAWITLALLIFATPWSVKLLIGAVLATTLISPPNGLLFVAALTPLGQLLTIEMGLSGFRTAEAIVVTFLVGWLLHPGEDRPGPRVVGTIGWLLAICVVASVATQTWQLGQVRPYRGELKDTFELIFYGYYLLEDRVGFVAGARILEGLALAAITCALFRQRPIVASRLPAAIVASAVAAAASSVLLSRGVAPAPILERYLRIGYRVSAHVGDVNAAGSYFAMTVLLALGMAFRMSSWRRVVWLVAAAIIATGLWFSASRTASAAAAGATAVAIGWSVISPMKPRTRLVAMTALVLAAAAIVSFRAIRLQANPDFRGAGFRQQFYAASVRMIGAAPLFGVGVGQYYRMSPLFLSPELAFDYGFENAHNYFLQIGGELGLVGLALFIAWVFFGVAEGVRAIGRAPRDYRLLGALAGVTALVITCLTGHPLLIDEVAFPFWIQFGLMVGLAGSVLRNREPTEESAKATRAMPHPWRVAAAAAAVMIVIATPLRARVPADPPATAAVDGFYAWETSAEGVRYRWSTQFGSLFVPATTTRAFIPVRMPANIPGITPLGVEIRALGIDRGRALVGEGWIDLNVPLPDVVPPARYKRIDLRVDRTWQPAIYLPGNPDMRAVGLQVGEPKLLREY